MDRDTMKILITGDLVINEIYDPTVKIDDKLTKLFKSSDYNIVNLEAPITSSNKGILKTGPHLKSDVKSTLDVIKYLNIKAVSLANNHIKDYGEKGVRDTIEFCQKNNINTLGAGENIEQASKPLTLKTDRGIKIGVISIAENEWASAEVQSAGANGMNFIKDITQLQKAKETNDFVILIIHGGHEYYNLPSPRMKAQYRFYAEQGADLIIGHHPHCVSGFEIHNNTPIYYSLGNFLFTRDNPHADWYHGLVLEVNITTNSIECKAHPITMEAKSYKLRLESDLKKTEILNRMNEYSKIITDNEKLEVEWEKFQSTKSKVYLDLWSPLSFIQSRYISGTLRKLGINMTNDTGLSLYLNLLRCESHRDLTIDIIKKRLLK